MGFGRERRRDTLRRPMDIERLAHMPTMRVAMTPFPYSVEAGDPLGRARAMMAEHAIHHLPVTEGGVLLGVISSREVALGRAGMPAGGAGGEPSVREACVPEVLVVEDTEPLDRVLAHMAGERRDAVVVTRRGKLVGVFTVTDACRLLAEWLRARFAGGDGGDDDAA